MARKNKQARAESITGGYAAIPWTVRHEPRGIWIARMDCHGEAECRRLDAGNLREIPPLVRRDEDAVVVLHPQVLGGGLAAHQPVDVLAQWVVHRLGRGVVGAHTGAAQFP